MITLWTRITFLLPFHPEITTEPSNTLYRPAPTISTTANISLLLLPAKFPLPYEWVHFVTRQRNHLQTAQGPWSHARHYSQEDMCIIEKGEKEEKDGGAHTYSCGRGPWPCSTEGARGVQQTCRQTNFLRIIVRLPAVDRNRVLC